MLIGIPHKGSLQAPGTAPKRRQHHTPIFEGRLIQGCAGAGLVPVICPPARATTRVAPTIRLRHDRNSVCSTATVGQNASALHGSGFPPTHKWAIGHTFEYTFDLPGTDNAGCRSTHTKEKSPQKPSRKNTSRSLQKASSKVGKPVHHPEPTRDEVEAKRQELGEYDRRRNQTEQRKEYQ